MGDKLFQSRISGDQHPELACPIEDSPMYSMPSSGMGSSVSCLRLFPSFTSETSPSNAAHRTNPPVAKHMSKADLIAEMQLLWSQGDDRSEWMLGVPGWGGVVNAVGGRRTMVEIAKAIYKLVSEPHAAPEQLLAFAKQLEELVATSAQLRAKIAEASKLRSLPTTISGMKADEALLSKQISQSTMELFTQINSSQKSWAPETFRQLVREIGELRSHLPKQ